MKFKKLLAIGICAVVIGVQVAPVQADTADEIAMVQQAQASTQAELGALENAIYEMENQKAAIMDKIDEYDKEMVTTMVAINSLDGAIGAAEKQLDQTGKDLAAAEADAQEQYEAMKQRIQYLYEHGGTDGWVNVMFGDETLSQGINKVDYTTSLYEYDRNELANYEKTIEQVDALKAQQVQQKSQLETMKMEQVEAMGNLTELKAVAETASDNYEEQIAAAEAVAYEYYAVIEQQNAVIAELQVRQAEEIAAQAAYEAAMAAQAAMMQEQMAAAEEYGEAPMEDAAYDEYAGEEYYDEYTGETYTEETYTGEENCDEYTGGESYSEDSYSDNSYSEDTNSGSSYGDDGVYYGEEMYTSGEQAAQQAAQQAAFDAGAAQVDTSGGAGSNGNAGTSAGQQIVDYAMQFVGNPYVWGGTSLTNGADCSGFVQSVFGDNGVSLSRTTYTQANEGIPVSYEDMIPGDVINYGFHTAIYIGNNQIVHAASDELGIIVQNNPAYQPIVTIRRYV